MDLKQKETNDTSVLKDGKAYVGIPKKMNPFLRFGIWLSEKLTGKELLPARVLTLYPKTLISSGILEGLVAHKDKNITHRLLKLVRIQTSFSVSCPFCIDMNSFRYKKSGISDEEISALQSGISLDKIKTLSLREKLALEYAGSASSSPLSFSERLIRQLQNHFSDREIVILASTIAQVNYWGRLIQSLGLPIAGFNEKTELLQLDKFTTLVK